MNNFQNELYMIEATCLNQIFGVQSEYFVETSLRVKVDVKDKLKKIMTAIKEFFSKLKKKIQEKLREAKLRRSLNGISKLVRGGSYEIIVDGKKVDSVDFDMSKFLIEKRLELFIKDAKKVMTLKNPKDIEAKFTKLYDKAVKDVDAYIELSNKSKPGHIHKAIVRRMALRKAAELTMQEVEGVNKDLDAIQDKLMGIVKDSTSIKSIFTESEGYTEFDMAMEPYMEAESIKDSISNVAVSISTKCSALGSKVGSFITAHPFKSIAIITAVTNIASASVGKSYGYAKGNQSGYKAGIFDGSSSEYGRGRKDIIPY